MIGWAGSPTRLIGLLWRSIGVSEAVNHSVRRGNSLSGAEQLRLESWSALQ